MRNKTDKPLPETPQAPPASPAPPTFHPRDWEGTLRDEVLQTISRVGGDRELGLAIVNRDLSNGLLEGVLVAPDLTPTLLSRADWEHRTVHAPHNPAEGVRVEPYEPGRYFVRRADPAKLKPARRGPPVQYDWDEGFQFMRRELDKRGDPVDPINAVKGWRSEADVARLVAAHVAIGRQQPDLKHTERTIRPKLKEWRAEQAERN